MDRFPENSQSTITKESGRSSKLLLTDRFWFGSAELSNYLLTALTETALSEKATDLTEEFIMEQAKTISKVCKMQMVNRNSGASMAKARRNPQIHH